MTHLMVFYGLNYIISLIIQRFLPVAVTYLQIILQDKLMHTNVLTHFCQAIQFYECNTDIRLDNSNVKRAL